MNLSGLRIGYVPSTPSFTAPSDRRRFVHYARRRDLTFEIASLSGTYDIVVLTQRADISAWRGYPRGRTKIIYDAIDSYLAIPSSDVKQALRGLVKYANRQNRFLELSYRKSIEQMCRRADAVICSTEEQRQLIQPFCGNVQLILDFQVNDAIAVKTDYARNETFNFVWEGLASSGIPTTLLREILEPISHQNKIALHLITDLVYYRYSDLYVKTHTVDVVNRNFGPFARHVYIYQWNPMVLSRMTTACDLALIPIPLDNPFQRGKPENKLLLFWRMGMPAVTSATPAYTQTMKRCYLPMACGSIADWHSVIQQYMGDEFARKHAGQTGRIFAETHYSEEQLLHRWDELFASL